LYPGEKDKNINLNWLAVATLLVEYLATTVTWRKLRKEKEIKNALA
jgi:hypothetical protein